MKDDQDVLFVYPKKINKAYVKKISKTTGQPMSMIVDKMIESYRVKKSLDIKPKVSKVLQKASKLPKYKGFTANAGKKQRDSSKG